MNFKQPKFIKSKYKTRCFETSKTINQGDQCLYYPQDKKVYHMDSATVYRFQNQRFDEQILTSSSFTFLNH